MMNSYNPFSLENKTILVTGASSGIGRAIAIECSKMGAKVIITARNEQRLNETLSQMDNGDHKIISADLLNADAIENLINNIDTKLDGIALCAGIGMSLPFQFLDKNKLQNIFNANFFSPIELACMLIKRKKIAKDASIVMIASAGGNFVFLPGQSAYASTKAALTAISKGMAIDLASKKIRVNSVSPGMIETPFIHSQMVLTDDDIQKDIQKYPLKRYGKPEEVAYAVIYLLSDASTWTTGSNLLIDGGYSLL